MPNPRVYFDLDGVLVDSRPGIVRCVNETLVAFGYAALESEQISKMIGPPLREGFAALLAEIGGRSEDAGPCVVEYRKRYGPISMDGGTFVQPGVVAMLASLCTRAELAVATSKSLRFAEPILETLGLRNHFLAVVGPTEATDGESKTETLARAIARMRESNGEIGTRRSLMFGDRYHDIAAAIACAVVPVGCTWGYGSETELRDAGAAHVLRDASEIVPLVEGFGTKS